MMAASCPTVVPDAAPAAKLVPDKLTSPTVWPGVVMMIADVVNGAIGGTVAAGVAVSVIEYDAALCTPLVTKLEPEIRKALASVPPTE